MTASGAEDRDWTQVRQAAIAAVTAVTGNPQTAPAITDAVLAVLGEETVSRMASSAPNSGNSPGTAPGLAHREEIARQILAQIVPCTEHPMPLPKPSCWECGRNGAFQRAARIALGKFPGPERPDEPHD